jgi:hypothetical protein
LELHPTRTTSSDFHLQFEAQFLVSTPGAPTCGRGKTSLNLPVEYRASLLGITPINILEGDQEWVRTIHLKGNGEAISDI